MTNHVLFIHGVNTRQNRDQAGYSSDLFNQIKANTNKKVEQTELYWGDVNKAEEAKLVGMWKNSSAWNELWFQEYREQQILQFIGDAALYISKSVGKLIISTLYEQLVEGFKNVSGSDPLHIVAHSWGSVILFDILFASRWDDDSEVQEIRKQIYGVPMHSSDNEFKNSGYKIASIHTMGSPISIYQLMHFNVDSQNTHEISTRLEDFVQGIHEQSGKPLIWNNYIHPCDPVGSPLEAVIPVLLSIHDKTKMQVADFVLSKSGITDFIADSVSQTQLAVLHGGAAHSSYWKSEFVAQKIVEHFVACPTVQKSTTLVTQPASTGTK